MTSRKAPTGLAPTDDLIYETLNFIAIAHQLLTTRANRRLAEGDLPFPQFVLLSHFSKDPARVRTVSGIAAAFQAPQPGITKTIAKLHRRGFVDMRASTSDKRVREVYVTTAGLVAFRAALKLLTPDTRLIFGEWRKNDIAALHDLLEKLKTWLDENRELRPVV
jgi:DNA-binding MarR family transcriptional regulator